MYTELKYKTIKEIGELYSEFGGDGKYIMVSSEIAETHGIDVSFFLGLLKTIMLQDAFSCKKNNWWIKIRMDLILKITGKTKHSIMPLIEKCINAGLLQFKSGKQLGCASLFRLTPKNEIQNSGDALSPEGGVAKPATPPKICGNLGQNISRGGCRETGDPPLTKTHSTNARVCAHANKVLNTIKKKYIRDGAQKKRNTPSVREIQFTEIFYEKVQCNFPNYKLFEITNEKINKGSEALHKLVKKHNNNFVFVSNVLMWALQHPFWKKQVRSIPALLKISQRTFDTKFENIACDFEISNTVEKEKTEQDIIQAHTKKHKYSEKDSKEAEENYRNFKRQLEKLKNVPTWLKNIKKLEPVILWFLNIDNGYYNPHNFSVHGFDNVSDALSHYTSHLDKLCSEGQIKEIYPGMFSDESSLFREFVKYIETNYQTKFFH